MIPSPKRYNISNFVDACKNPTIFLKEFSTVSNSLREKSLKYPFIWEYEEPTNVMEEDWDNLIILDACRYDSFVDMNNISGQLDSIISVSSTSPEFMEKTFKEREFHDTVCVSANGF